ncbi:MAG: hypothetical protein K2L42_04195 [Clostridia bacterium]|nr:hypothetical protein [Clostridia bacterium]
MKRKLPFIAIVFILILCMLPACEISASGSLKSLTKPYIAEYVCTDARLGEENLLDKYEFIKITLLDSKELEVSFKPKGGEKRAFKGNYSVDGETREFTGKIGIFGVTFKETAKIENGKFTITKNILSKTLVMKFEMK